MEKPKDELVSRSVILDECRLLKVHGFGNTSEQRYYYNAALDAIISRVQLAEDLTPKTRTNTWKVVYHTTQIPSKFFQCTGCGAEVKRKTRWCANCGSRMYFDGQKVL